MPYKDPKKQAEYMRKYRTPYMREYERRKKNMVNKLTKDLTADAEQYSKVMLAQLQAKMDTAEKEKLRKEQVERELNEFFCPLFKHLSLEQIDRICVAIEKDMLITGDAAMRMSQAKKYFLEKVREELKASPKR